MQCQQICDLHLLDILLHNSFFFHPFILRWIYKNIYYQYIINNFVFLIVNTITNSPLFPPFAHLHPCPTLRSLWCHHTTLLSVSMGSLHIWSSPSFLSAPPLTAVSLFHVSTPLFLFCFQFILFIRLSYSNDSIYHCNI